MTGVGRKEYITDGEFKWVMTHEGPSLRMVRGWWLTSAFKCFVWSKTSYRIYWVVFTIGIAFDL